VDYQSRLGVSANKSWRDRLIRLTQAHPDWLLGFEDEVWWSRVNHPDLHAWSPDGQPLRLVEQTVATPTKRRPAQPKALACYGLLTRAYPGDGSCQEAIWLRFVDGRPVSGVTTQFLAWCAERAASHGKTAVLLVWDNASWHVSAEVRTWLRAHNRRVKHSGQGARLLACPLPSKSPWLNPIEPKWIHGKRAVVEPARVLPAAELEERICAYYGCDQHPRLTNSDEPTPPATVPLTAGGGLPWPHTRTEQAA
jgi:DDE superfamily endonuclease